MNRAHAWQQLLRLLRDAETPLYSAYRHLSRDLAEAVSLDTFASDVQERLARGILQLWLYQDERRRELSNVPRDLASRYEVVELDESYDPFGYTLTLGPKMPREDSAWNFDVDYARGQFVWVGDATMAESSLQRIRYIDPDHRFVVEDRDLDGSTLRMRGRVEEI